MAIRSNIPSAPLNAAVWAGVNSSAGELNYLDITAAGTVQASKAVVVDGNKDATGFRHITATGTVQAEQLTTTDDATVTGALTVGETLAVTGLIGSQSITATADGLTTGIISDAGFVVALVTSADANHIVTLPTPTPGTIVIAAVGANGCEFRSDTPASVAISGGTGANAESAIPANSLVFLVCISATAWLGFDITGTTLAAVEAAV